MHARKEVELRALVLLCWLAAAAAQEPQAAAPPILRAEAVGPAAFRQRLLPTDLGGLLLAPDGPLSVQPALAGLADRARELFQDDDRFAAARERWLGYGGRIQFVAWIDRAAADDRDPGVVAGLLLHGDGSTDPKLLADDLRHLCERAFGRASAPVDVDGGPVEAWADTGLVLSAPRCEEGRVLLAYAQGDSLAAALRCVRGSAALPPLAAATGALCGLRLDVAQASALVHSPLLHGGTRELGIDSLGALDLAAAAAGPRLAFDLSLTFRGRDRGMFAGLLPEPAGLSPLLALVSADDPIWSAARLDLAAAARAAMQAAAVWSSQAPAELAADLRQQLGIDLVDDLLAHATGEIMWLTAPGAAAHDDQPPGAADFALAIRLRDEAAFRQGFRTLLQHSRGFLTRLEDLPHDGATIWRCGGPFTASDCHVAIGAGMFCLAVGPRAVPRLRAWLDAAGAGALRGEPALPPEFAGAQRTTADGLRSAGRIDLGAALRLLAQREPSPLATLLRKLVEVPSLLPAGDDADADGIADALQEVVAVLGNRKLAAIQCLAGHGDGRWWCRMLW